MDEHKLLRERERGHQAKQITDNPVFQEVWARMDANLVQTMSSPQTPDENVLEARRGLIVLRRVKAEIEKEFQTGLMAQTQMDQPNR